MSEGQNLYHSPQVYGFWTEMGMFNRDILLRDGALLNEVIPIGIRRQDDDLVMVLSTFEGHITESINHFPGLIVVRGDSQSHPYETDGELLIEFIYFKIDRTEARPRRIRPNAIMFGIFGDNSEESAERGGHRAMGESADFYLVGVDTQYDPKRDSVSGLRQFPFWRIGVWGDPIQLAHEYLPLPPPTGE